MVKAVYPLPMVRTSSGHFVPWSREAIVNSLLKETRLAKMFFDIRPMRREEAEAIALVVEEKIRSMNLKFISGPLIREVVNNVLLEEGSRNPVYRIYRNIYTRVGTPVYDAYEIDIGKGFEAKENANLQPNAETSHKKKADKTSKEEYLLLMPPPLADAHLRGEIHIHDLEYFGTRPFCMDASVVVPIVKGNFLRIKPIGTIVDALFKEYPQNAIRKDGYEILEVSELNLFVLGRDSLKKIKKVMRRPAVSPALEITTAKHRRIILTKEHFIQTNNGTVPVSDVTKGTKLIVGSIPWIEGNVTESNLVNAFLMSHGSVKDSDYTDEVKEVKEVTPTGRYYYDIEVEADDEDERLFYAGNEGLILIHNCQDWDLRYFFYYGFMPDGTGIKTSVARAAQRPEVAVLHSVKVLAAAQTNFAGGEGFYNYLVFLAPYMRGLSYDHVKQLMQMMFYELTQIYVARGGQPVFSNIQITPGVPEIWRDVPIVARGKIGPDKYGEYEDEVRMLYRALNEVALEGDYWGKLFNFPKLENGITPELFNSEYEEEWLLAHKVVSKFGSPYFDNMMPEYRGYGKGVSCYQCCAYSFVDTPDSDPEFEEKLYFVGGKHFSMGSWQVVTINLPRAAYKAKGDDSRLFEEVRRLMGVCVEVFKAKHRWMRLMIENNRIPFATQRPRDPVTGERAPPPVDFNELVWTIGLVGANEMAQHHTGYQLHESKEAVRIVVRLLLDMRSYLKELEEKHGFKLALARTPAESCAQRLAVCDLLDPEFGVEARKVVKGELKAAERLLATGERDVPVYYSNGTHVYVGAKIPLLERLSIENKFFPILSGGNMFHIWLGEANPDPESLYKFTKRIAMQTQIGYFAYTKDLTICENCNRVSGGLSSHCTVCGSTNVKWWSRVTGYYQDVTGWNKAKQHEFLERYRVSIP